jgi:hypothetical protein
LYSSSNWEGCDLCSLTRLPTRNATIARIGRIQMIPAAEFEITEFGKIRNMNSS